MSATRMSATRMSATRGSQATLVHSLATLLRNDGDSVLDGSSVLTLHAGCVQHLTRLFEQYLLSRAHQHGFLALPSHPADTASLLQVQFIFDMLQKTLALKLVSPPGSSLQSVVKIFPFKSLKHLELKRIPPGCLEGLRGVYSQLEVFTCSKSLTTLKELLSHCGGDLSSALPWLELHTLNFSYNSISSLDESLSLLNVLKSLDLSHNRIRDCAEFLMPLSELQHLNLAYNNLQRVPQLGQDSRAKLITLVLRNNELETINGMEQLSSLQHLDLAYNLLMEHLNLTPLSGLHNLQMLILEGNPLYFQKTHRTSTVCHLSPRAAAQGAVPKQKMGQTCQTRQVAMAPEQMVQDASSGGGDMSDSLSVSESGAGRIHRRKSKVKVRTASISEPSDTDHEPRQTALQDILDIVLHHQKDIERMDSFREQMGEDWLRFQHHLDGTQDPTPASTPRTEGAAAQVTAHGCHAPFAPEPTSAPQPPRPQALPAPLLSSEPKGGEELQSSDQLDTESTLQWSGHSPLSTESTLEMSTGEPQASGKACALSAPPDEEEDLGVDLCRPMLVQVLSEAEETDGVTPLFLRVRQGHVQEVDVQQGRVRTQLELACLRNVAVSQATWIEKEKERSHPALELHFNYINRSRKKRRYIVLDDDPQCAVQALAEVLSSVVAENMQQAMEGRNRGVRLQCLRCRAEVPQLEAGRLAEALRDPPAYQARPGETGGEGHTPGDIVYCPECNSDHVVQLAGQAAPSTSTPVYCDAVQNRNRCFNFDDIDTSVRLQLPFKSQSLDASLLASGSPLHVTQDSEFSTVQEGVTDTFLTAHSSLSNLATNHSEAWFDQPIGFHSADIQAQADPEVTEDELEGSGTGSKEHPKPWAPHARGPAPFDLMSEDFEAVDHRLKLFLDVEVFEGEEEIHCFLKMSIVKFGDPVEFPALMVVSDQHIYILEMTSQSEGQPSDWLRKRAHHRLRELTYLEVGLGSQTIHMEFDEGGAAYTLLVRDSVRCRRFYGRLTGITRELAPKSDSKLRGISTTRLNPKHHLWPLVCDGSEMAAEEVTHPPFLYLLAFLQRDDSLTSVTVLATREMLCLLDEDHQWSKRQSELPANEEGQTNSTRVTVREVQPISCVSSIHLSSSDPCQVDIKLYDEMAKEERTWPLRTEASQEIESLVAWVRTQWEAMFGVKLLTAIQ
ncbi:serine/threonine-protein kinase 11-interacting protein isoform X2 [Electrophorus electricus]|uniref:serine/threonine-protein kinase 11-interacting protein isoform X2 n=1 Tax=Electrophorus electricus TaxID=8005 RepID=UPI0015CF94E8|nr:serine/threonine-protein kinase 11-interacting protein isoform X2 [Electrophorus electricus]